jgi:hypothetical protein
MLANPDRPACFSSRQSPRPYSECTVTRCHIGSATFSKSVDHEVKVVKLAGRPTSSVAIIGAEKDAANRSAILATLERHLKKGDKSLVGNTGYRRFLTIGGDGSFAIDHAKAEEDAKFDGVFVLPTNTNLAPLDGTLCTLASIAPHSNHCPYETR